MGSKRQSVVENHFLHPEHPLKLYNRPFSVRVRALLGGKPVPGFICDGCMTDSTGWRYRCVPCDFDLHIDCAYCPRTATSPLHAQHALTLVRGLCTLCSKPIKGTPSYRCHSCGLDFHGRCLDIGSVFGFPLTIFSPLHHQHELSRLSLRCADCDEEMQGMFYGCVDCGFGLHPLCHLKRAGPASTATSTIYFFLHPEHELKADDRGGKACYCSACGDAIASGGRYSCAACNFHVHKGCADVKPTVRDAAHPAHVLHYQQSVASACAACGETCVTGRYHCSLCNVDVHRGCLKGSFAAS